MRIYLASPNTQQQAEHVTGKDVLLSFASWAPWLERYQAGFSRILIDSGAYSELNSGVTIDPLEYRDWSGAWLDHADAIAGLDDISGDWRRSLRNYETVPWSFPTIHDTDPPELLYDLISMASERSSWLGVGLKPPRQGKGRWLRETLARVPSSIHVHGWACVAYTAIRRLDSVDSTNWWRDGMAFRRDMPWLHYGECLDLVIKRIERRHRGRDVGDSQIGLDLGVGA